MFAQAVSQLDAWHLAFFFAALVLVCTFEFVNGFHDTANAVATVIYTRSLAPVTAVIWSGLWNFLGVWFGGIAVAMGILKLLPIDEIMLMPQGENIAVVFGILFAAIAWNLSTWYFGIPCSSSHTLIGSILGAGLGFFLVQGGQGVNWSKAGDIGLSLLLSPAFGFSAVILMLFLLSYVVRRKDIFKSPAQNENRPPPFWIRSTLITTCTLVSFFHGNNDGQKGTGMLMIILLAMLPGYYALNPQYSAIELREAITSMKSASSAYTAEVAFNPYKKPLAALDEIESSLEAPAGTGASGKLELRKRIQVFTEDANTMLNDPGFMPNASQRQEFKSGLKTLTSSTDFAPIEAILLIAFSLGIGTMVGWKRIVVTIGEKIGKTHLTYAQGAAAELVAAGTIGMSSGLGLPVSTTHVLSSGIAGSMVGAGGIRNLRRDTITTIALAWLLTLPVTFAGGFVGYFFFHWLFGGIR